MRLIEKDERRQRGCRFCLDYKGAKRCPHDKCPYTELDGYTDYEDYFNATGANLKQIFADIFTLDERR